MWVAEGRVELPTSGYEPDEIPFLYSAIVVDQMRIELTTGALQVLLAPLDHAGPIVFTHNNNLSIPHQEFGSAASISMGLIF